MSNDEMISKLADESAMWKSFMETAAWKEYANILKGQLVTRRAEIDSLMATPSQDAVIQRLAKDHEIAGIKLALAMPSLIIQDNDISIQRLIELDEENEQ